VTPSLIVISSLCQSGPQLAWLVEVLFEGKGGKGENGGGGLGGSFMRSNTAAQWWFSRAERSLYTRARYTFVRTWKLLLNPGNWRRPGGERGGGGANGPRCIHLGACQHMCMPRSGGAYFFSIFFSTIFEHHIHFMIMFHLTPHPRTSKFNANSQYS